MLAQVLAVAGAAGLVAAAPATSSCPYYSGLAPFTADPGCASAYCDNFVASTSTTITTLSPGETITKTVFTLATPSVNAATVTVTDYTATVVSTLVVAQTEASFVFPSYSTTVTDTPAASGVARRQEYPATATVSPISCPEITKPPPQDLASASAACNCYITSTPTYTVTLTQGAPGQCGAAPTVTTTITQTPAEVAPTSSVTVDGTATSYVITGATAYTTVACSTPEPVAALPTCTGAQVFGLKIAACGSPYDGFYFVPELNTTSGLANVAAISSTSFIGPYYDDFFEGTHQELGPWFANTTSQDGLIANANPISTDTTANAHLLSQLVFDRVGTSYNTLSCFQNNTIDAPWECDIYGADNKLESLNYFVRHSDAQVLVGPGGLVDTADYTQVLPFHIALCNLPLALTQPPTTNE